MNGFFRGTLWVVLLGIVLFRLVPREARFVAGLAMAYTITPAELMEASSIPPRLLR